MFIFLFSFNFKEFQECLYKEIVIKELRFNNYHFMVANKNFFLFQYHVYTTEKVHHRVQSTQHDGVYLSSTSM